MNLYNDSWELYKFHSEEFNNDFEYYLNLCKGYKTLELFAGYGRLSNYLAKNGVDITAVELEPEFAKYIDIPANKKHIQDVRYFEITERFERIIAGFNSFCLLTNERDIEKFFMMLNTLLTPGGIASLSYYHQDYWGDDYIHQFEFKGNIVQYVPTCDLSEIKQNRGVWIDAYKGKAINIRFEYPVRLYENSQSILPFLKQTELQILDTVYDYNKTKDFIPGFMDFVLQKKQ